MLVYGIFASASEVGEGGFRKQGVDCVAMAGAAGTADDAAQSNDASAVPKNGEGASGVVPLDLSYQDSHFHHGAHRQPCEHCGRIPSTLFNSLPFGTVCLGRSWGKGPLAV